MADYISKKMSKNALYVADDFGHLFAKYHFKDWLIF